MKLKSLTLEQFVKIADKHFNNGTCRYCPFYKLNIRCYRYCESSKDQKKHFKASLKRRVKVDKEL